MPTSDERTIPILPCRSIDEITEFYCMLGFDVTYRQARPNPYAALQRGGIHLHFFALPEFAPEQSYGSCIITVRDTAELFEAFAAGMRATHGKLLISGIPRITRPRKRKNTGNTSGFTIVDPGGNWIRISQSDGSHADDTTETTGGVLARTLENAVVLGESKGDHRQAAKILDAKLTTTPDGAGSVIELVEALAYRAELALRLDDRATATKLLARVRDTTLDESQRKDLSDALANVAELQRVVHRAGLS